MSIPEELAAHPVVRKLQTFNPNAVTAATNFRDQLALTVAPSLIVEVCQFLRDDRELQFNMLADLTAVDRYPVEPRFEIIYQLLSIPAGRRVRLKAAVPGTNPRIASVTGLWPGANMLEREVFDLFGVRFEGHPDLRRLLMPDDWEGHPLRKDYPVEGYR